MWGGFQFSWLMLYAAFPRASFFALFNPVTYAFEGLRATILGDAQFLPFWISCSALVVLTMLFGAWALELMRKRLDYVG